MIDRVFDRLTVLARAGSNRHRRALWLCRCRCGRELVVRGHALTSRWTKSCGCLQADVATSLMHDIVDRRRAA